jgi:hypothetical protein
MTALAASLHELWSWCFDLGLLRCLRWFGFAVLFHNCRVSLPVRSPAQSQALVQVCGAPFNGERDASSAVEKGRLFKGWASAVAE